jgi:hypothetical protein
MQFMEAPRINHQTSSDMNTKRDLPTPISCISRLREEILFAYVALLISFGTLFFCGVVPPWYSAGLPTRAQTDALLRGELALSHNPADMRLDLCWSEGGIHQVWGLGVPLWRLPFEALARLFRQPTFPDRVALGLFMALITYVGLRTWFGTSSRRFGSYGVSAGSPSTCSGDHPGFQSEISELNGRGRLAIAVGASVMCLLFAPVVNLLRSTMTQYEEVLVYVHFFEIALMCGIVALARCPSWGRFWFLCGLAGVGGLIRPTIVFYGFSTVAVATFIMISAGGSKNWRQLLGGIFLFTLGGGVLYLTNLLRFGSGWEFGHSLNFSSALTLVYTTRFDNPFGHVPLLEAAKELFGAMFLVNRFNGTAWYDQGIFQGQSTTIRWRMIDLTTYDLSYAGLIAIAWLLGGWLLWRWWLFAGKSMCLRRGGFPLPPITSILILWSLLSASPLGYFYVKAPPLASRYLLDFMPAFIAALIGLWWWTIETLGRRERSLNWTLAGLCFCLVGWQAWEISEGRSGFGSPRSMTEDQVLAVVQQKPPMLQSLPTEYKIGDPMASWHVQFNGQGWHPDDGRLWCGAIFIVKDPEFLELHLKRQPEDRLNHCAITDIRAKVGLEFLHRASITQKDEGWIVRFDKPKQARYQHGVQAVFLGIVPAEEIANCVIPPSPWILEKIQWEGALGE